MLWRRASSPSAVTLTQLRYLVALDEHRHFGRAAEACHVSQPTLSAQIRRLEEQLGVELVDRTRTPVAPTPVGRRVLARARRVLAEADAIPALLAEADAVAGDLRVGVIPTLAPYLLPGLLPVLRARHPDLRLVVGEWTTAQVLDALEAGRLDAGLIATDDARPGLVVERLFREPFVAYLGPGHPAAVRDRLRPEDLGGEGLRLLAEGHCLRDQAQQVCQVLPGTGTDRFETGSLETLRLLVDATGGATLLPALAVPYLPEAARARVRPFEPPVPARAVRLVRPRGGVRARAVAALAAAVRERAADALGEQGRS